MSFINQFNVKIDGSHIADLSKMPSGKWSMKLPTESDDKICSSFDDAIDTLIKQTDHNNF